ncbi:MAG: sigma-70 family RNA polymerase sigma factor [Clostridia bacterium]|nr:sigma-70 family RNA polymerase sigma factor [Clostridia bacterium]
MNNNIQELYEKYYPAVYKYFCKKIGENDAEDLAQQTYVKILTWIGCVEKIRSPKAFIFKVAKSVLYDYLRKKMLMAQAIPFDNLYDCADNHNFIEDVESSDALKSLSKQEQHIVTLKTEGYNSTEIGKILGVSGSTIRTHLQNIRKKIK